MKTKNHFYSNELPEPDNYLGKNLRTLRTMRKLSQAAFGSLFNLSRDMVRSYENGTEIGLLKFHEIMNYFDLDSNKFIDLDMELHDVSKKTHESNSLNKPSTLPKLNDFVKESDQYKYLNDLSGDKVLGMCKALLRTKEEMKKQLIDCQSFIIELQKENNKLLIELRQKE